MLDMFALLLAVFRLSIQQTVAMHNFVEIEQTKAIIRSTAIDAVNQRVYYCCGPEPENIVLYELKSKSINPSFSVTTEVDPSENQQSYIDYFDGFLAVAKSSLKLLIF